MKHISPLLTDKSIDILVALRGKDGLNRDAQIVERALELYFSVTQQTKPEGVPVKLTTADWQAEQ